MNSVYYTAFPEIFENPVTMAKIGDLGGTCYAVITPNRVEDDGTLSWDVIGWSNRKKAFMQAVQFADHGRGAYLIDTQERKVLAYLTAFCPCE